MSRKIKPGQKSTKLIHVDLSHSITDGDRPYRGDPPTVIEQWSTLKRDHFRLKHMSFGSHSSTHMDSPSHLLAEGRTLDRYDPRSFFVEAFVLDVKNLPGIGLNQVQTIPSGVQAVLFSTGWAERWNSERYFEDPPLLTEEAATLLLERDIRLFGFDSSSCDALASETLPIHHMIFSYGCLILENLNNLDRVVGRTVSLVALPLRIHDSDGAPTRVIASYWD
ncbi:MAG TPA: cyclase family protein [Sphaerochaeta sp.]|nr:cyclase family protein [Sphaerochaeta sp.]